MTQETVLENQKLVIKRVFNAPVERVYSAWTDPNQLVKWFASNERWRTPVIDVDTKAGGKHDIRMRHSDGDEYLMSGHYVEIVPNTRISFTWNIDDKSLGSVETLVTVEFRSAPGGTELTLIHDRLEGSSGEGVSEGWTGCLSMLEGYLIDGVELKAPGQ